MKKRLTAFLIACMLVGVSLTGCQGKADSGDSVKNAGEDTHEDAEAKSGEGTEEEGTKDAFDVRDLQPEGEVLKVCVDACFKTSAQNLVEACRRLYEGMQIELVVIPKNETEAEARISQLRTEIMAGEGPDVFIVRCIDPLWVEQSPVLFDNPEKMMYSQVFLPLDEYMSQARYMNLEDMNEAVMNAGKTDEGQVILPLWYQYYLAVFSADDLQEQVPQTWEELMECKDPAIMKQIASCLSLRFYSLFGRIADYQAENLLISEKELTELIREAAAYTQQGWTIESSADTAASGHLDETIFGELKKDKEQEHAFLVLPNTDGGITANVTMFAAVNRNTEQPAAAFTLLDLLCSDEVVNGSGFVFEEDGIEKYYGNRVEFVTTANGGMPLNNSIFEKQCSGLSEKDAASMRELNDRITTARFFSTLDNDLVDLYSKCWQLQDEEELENAVSQAYDAIRMTLAE